MTDIRRNYLESRAPNGTVVLDCNIGPLIFAEDSPYVRGLTRSPIHDPGVVHFMRAHRERLFPFYDVGANVGLFSILAAQMANPGDRVIAFEPDIKNLEYLAINLQAYDATNVEVWAVGITFKDGPIELGEINCGRSAHSKIGASTFPGRSLLSVSAEIGITPAFIKIDIEGGEADALAGAYTPQFSQTIFEIEYCPRDHRKRLPELIEQRHLETYSWDFVVTDADASEIDIQSANTLVSGATPLRLISASTSEELHHILSRLDKLILERPSRKWELCISPKDHSLHR